ncbi:hypothetical protein IP87_01685 [beta proteobacterium AAP121]|nr:hypothetical protein IP80_02315 [beta proteobacterium AAP65]KPG00710.1 hypothetical protein IP87_01685 [beta proteobacterium AAP121]
MNLPANIIIPTRQRRRFSPPLLVLGGLALAASGLAAGLVLGTQHARPAAAGTAALSSPAADARPSLPGAHAVSAHVCRSCGTVEGVQAVQAGGAKLRTAFQVRVRMDDGSLRSFTSPTAPTPGLEVRVEGESYRVVQRKAEEAPRSVPTKG